jgi:pyruvate/2-oxoglutarate dehydrogenase complex dihydrolipoamide dehydrogenase (E3) component
LTPVAALEAHAMVDNLLGSKRATIDATGIPSAVFSLPPIARVGLLEAEAKAQGLRFKVKHGRSRLVYCTPCQQTLLRVQGTGGGWK